MTPAKQQVATVRGSDTSAKELYVYNNAGKAGRAGGSVLLRDVHSNGTLHGDHAGEDTVDKWGDAASGTFDTRYYHLINADGSVAHVTNAAGFTMEHWQYNRSGAPS